MGSWRDRGAEPAFAAGVKGCSTRTSTDNGYPADGSPRSAYLCNSTPGLLEGICRISQGGRRAGGPRVALPSARTTQTARPPGRRAARRALVEVTDEPRCPAWGAAVPPVSTRPRRVLEDHAGRPRPTTSDRGWSRHSDLPIKRSERSPRCARLLPCCRRCSPAAVVAISSRPGTVLVTLRIPSATTADTPSTLTRIGCGAARCCRRCRRGCRSARYRLASTCHAPCCASAPKTWRARRMTLPC